MISKTYTAEADRAGLDNLGRTRVMRGSGAAGRAGVADSPVRASTRRQRRAPTVCGVDAAAHPLQPTVAQPLGSFETAFK